jgi:hypothetical protein
VLCVLTNGSSEYARPLHHQGCAATYILTGLVFLCWPNLAYHLGNLFEEWPTTEGRIESAQQQSSSRFAVAYDFVVGGERYGGHGTVESDGIGADVSAKEMQVSIRYDPLNPSRSSRIEGIKPE